MTKAIQFTHTGGPEVLQLADVNVGAPGPGEVRIAHKAVGLNYIDVYHRTGLYPLPLPPFEGRRPRGLRQRTTRKLLRSAGHASQKRVQIA